MPDLHIRRIETCLAIVERTLRRTFPQDFYKRCAYAAYGTATLMRDHGVCAEIVGGDFAAFIMSTDHRRAGMQGFAFGESQCSHFWVEAGGRLLDVAPHLLPHDASYPVVPMPAVAWDLVHTLPRSLQYREQDRFPDSVLMGDPEIVARMERFVAACRDRMKQQKGALRFPTWVITDPEALLAEASKRNPWAVGAVRFGQHIDPLDLPFCEPPQRHYRALGLGN